MNYLLAFIFCGVVCAISQYALEKTKLTPGHINTSLVIVGSIISSFGLYDKLIEIFHSGATIPIVNFGNLLVNGAYQGYMEYGFIGLFKGIFSLAGSGISFAIVCAFLVSLFCKVKH